MPIEAVCSISASRLATVLARMRTGGRSSSKIELATERLDWKLLVRFLPRLLANPSTIYPPLALRAGYATLLSPASFLNLNPLTSSFMRFFSL